MRRSTPITVARLAPAAARILVATALALLLSAVGLAAVPAGHPTNARPTPAVSGACLGAAAPTAATGTLVLVGNSTPLPSVVGVSVRADYFYTEIQKVDNSTAESCVPTVAYGTTTAGGSFSIALPIPSDRCLPAVCTLYAGPFGPLGYATSGAPAGFFEQDPGGGTSPGTIGWYAELSEARLNVTGTEVVSTNAHVDLSATAWNSVGNPASGPLTYAFNLAGLEWGIWSQTGPNVTVVGTDSGWTGSLSVTVAATYGTTTESAQSAVLSLLPVSTRVLSATASPTPVDPGAPVTFYVTGSGAAGYTYSATVDPGLGAGSVSGSCDSARLPNGTANLTCHVQAAYPAAGIAFPTASISNGYSDSQLSLGPVSVHPVEQVTLTAPTPVTYPNRTIEVAVNVTNGTGSAPYGPACLAVNGVRTLTCLSQNSTAWVFDVTFPAPGEYELRASVVDRFGENVSSSAAVVVVPILTARVNGSSSLTLFANETAALSVVVAGGALPITAWWNSSRSAVFSCPDYVDSDGPVTCPYQPSSPGSTNLTVTLRDALGSETSVVFRLNVTSTPVRSGTPSGSVFAGTSGRILFGFLTALAVGVLLVAWDVRRRRTPATDLRGDRVEENELERMARGRDHLLAQADPVTPRRPDELVAAWTGPPVAPEEWAEWVAALVADGSLIPSRAPDRRLVYRRAAPRPSAPTIQFDPTMLPTTPGPLEEEDSPTEPRGGQGGG